MERWLEGWQKLLGGMPLDSETQLGWMLLGRMQLEQMQLERMQLERMQLERMQLERMQLGRMQLERMQLGWTKLLSWKQSLCLKKLPHQTKLLGSKPPGSHRPHALLAR